MTNFRSTTHFPFLVVIALETGFNDFMETGQNFSMRLWKIGTFSVDCWDMNMFLIDI